MEVAFYRLKSFLGIKTSRKDISFFFRHASKKEQKKVLLEVIEKANQDQKHLVEKITKK